MKTTKIRRNICDVRITWLIRPHIAQCIEIDQLNARWREPRDEDFFMSQINSDESRHGLVAVLPGSHDAPLEVLGFVLYRYGNIGCKIDSISVHPSSWRRGIGWKLIDTLKARCKEKQTMLYTLLHEDDVERRGFFVAQQFNGGGRIEGDPALVLYEHLPN